MSFRFDRSVFESADFNERLRERLTGALNPKSRRHVERADEAGNEDDNSGHQRKSGGSLDILKNDIIVEKVDFSRIPNLEILDLDVGLGVSSISSGGGGSSMMKGICKISIEGAMLQVRTVIESNLLMLSMADSPEFVTPTLITNDSFSLPITMTFSNIKMEAISKVFFVARNSGIGISFDDVVLDFKFDCSIKMLQTTIEKRLKRAMELLFKDTLPTALFNMSQSWFTNSDGSRSSAKHKKDTCDENNQPSTPKIIFEDADLQELSPANMLRLSTLVSSRQTLSLHSTVSSTLSLIPGCLERQNLYRFISRMPSLSNYYSSYVDHKKERAGTPSLLMNKRPSVDYLLRRSSSSGNSLMSSQAYFDKESNLLPMEVLEENAYDLDVITDIQNKLYMRSTDHDEQVNHTKPRRRKIKIGKNKKDKPAYKEEIEQQEPVQSTITVSMPFEEPQIIIEHNDETEAVKEERESVLSSPKLIRSTMDRTYTNSRILNTLLQKNGNLLDEETRLRAQSIDSVAHTKMGYLLGLNHIATPPPPPYY